MLIRLLDHFGFIPKHHKTSLQEQIVAKTDYIAVLIARNETLKTKLAEARTKVLEKQGVIDQLNTRLLTLKAKLK